MKGYHIVYGKEITKSGVVFALALLCCALWGSAFPCVKIGYEWLAIEGAGSQIPVCRDTGSSWRNLYISDRKFS